MYYLKSYNISCAFWNFLYVLIERIPFFKFTIRAEHDKAIINYLSKKYFDLIKDFADRQLVYTENIHPSSTVWIFWWDGLEAMPDIVRVCYNSVQKYAGSYNIQLITKYNYKDFISIPEYILEKLNSGVITITHFSDILRMSLLYKFGGIYLDATLFVTKEINLSSYPFFTIKSDYQTDNISMARWTGFCIAGTSGHIFFEYMIKFFYAYWENNTNLIDYFLIDYAIALAYKFIPPIKSVIDSVPLTNPGLYLLKDNLQTVYSEESFNDICSRADFHKFSRKTINVEYSSQNELTFYGYIAKIFG